MRGGSPNYTTELQRTRGMRAGSEASAEWELMGGPKGTKAWVKHYAPGGWGGGVGGALNADRGCDEGGRVRVDVQIGLEILTRKGKTAAEGVPAKGGRSRLGSARKTTLLGL